MSPPRRRSSFPLSVTIFFALYFVAGLTLSVTQGNTEFIFYGIVLLIIASVIFWLHRRCQLSAPLLWGLAVWGLLHLAGGLIYIPQDLAHNAQAGEQPVLYNLWLIQDNFKYDHLTHVFGFGLCTWLCWQCLSTYIHETYRRTLYPSLGTLVLCALGAQGLGALNEVIEFAATTNISDTNVGGYANTSWDLIANLAGSVIAALLLSFKR